jgi:CRP/FNR family transcriptional regulator
MATRAASRYYVTASTAAWIILQPDESAYTSATSPGGRIARLITDHPFMHRRRQRGEYLFRTGDNFNHLYVLGSGFVKASSVTENGVLQTTGFHLRGDILGLDAVSTGHHVCDAIALDTCDVLAIPYDIVIACSLRNPDLVRELYRAFSAEIRSDREQMLNFRNLPAAGRVAAFLLETSARLAARGFSATKLLMRLTREEIGSMLGLKLETVSRAFSRFAQLRLIEVCVREITLLDSAGLRNVVMQQSAFEPDQDNGRSRCAPLAPPRITAEIQLAAGISA